MDEAEQRALERFHARWRKDAHLLPDGHRLNAGARLARFS
jgi:hypothetical protein